MPTPTVSLLLLCHNRDGYLEQAIASVLAQTYTDFELLIWDDGSTDRSLEIAQTFAQRDRRIRIIAAPHQDGAIARVRQQAIAQTQGEYLGWLDDDDCLLPTALEQTVAVLNRQPAVGMVYTDHQIIDEAGYVRGEGKRCHLPYSRDRLLVDFLTFHFRLMRRAIYEQVGGINPAYAYAYDYDLCLRLSEVTEVHHLAQPLYHYRQHPYSRSATRQLQRVLWSRRAVHEALVRRGLGDRLSLSVGLGLRSNNELYSEFSLYAREPELTLDSDSWSDSGSRVNSGSPA
ncbi:MAG: glycosyltransferase [Cyanobacteria bacterium J06638_22]